MKLNVQNQSKNTQRKFFKNKHDLLVFVFGCVTTMLFAQPQNIIDSGDVWQETNYYRDNFGFAHRADYYYRVGGDTVIDGNVYRSLWKTTRVWDYENPTWDWRNFSLVMRQDTMTRKIYYRNRGGGDRLRYDFDYNEGEYLSHEAEMYPPINNYRVTSDTIILSFSDSLHVLRINDSYNFCGEPLYLIDGIGSTEGFSTPIAHFEDPPGCLACYAKNGKIVYSGVEPYQFCDKITSIEKNKQVSQSTQLHIFPNPYSSAQGQLSIRGNFSIPTLVSIYAVTGEKLRQTTISGLNPAIKIPTLSPGIYMVKSHLHNKIARLVIH